jgi:hypothetical protein
MANRARKAYLYIFSFLAFCQLYGTGWTQDSLLPPPALIALSNHNAQVPLFWFAPGTQPLEIGYNDDSATPKYVHTEWKQNQVALRLNLSDYLPCFVETVKIYLVNEDHFPSLPGNQNSSFQISVNRDSSGVPGKTLWGPFLIKADSLNWDAYGQWLSVPVNIFLQSDTTLWIVFYWLEQTPTAPLVGLSSDPDEFNSYFAHFNGEILDWQIYSEGNLMFRASILTNNFNSSLQLQADSFNLYRTTDPAGTFTPADRWLALPSDSTQFVDNNLSNGQLYRYAISAVDSGQESPLQTSSPVVPRQGAILSLSASAKQFETLPDSVLADSILISNTGDLPLSLQRQVRILDSLGNQISDNWGHFWKSNQTDPDLAFNWIDIQQDENLIAQGPVDQRSWGPFLLNFPFSFYGKTFDSFRICSKGFISFTSPDSAFNNTILPFSGGRFNLIAPFWDDLLLTDSSKIYFQTSSETTVVSFVNLSRHPSGGNFSFQIILTQEGAIAFQYLKMFGTTSSATVGIQNHNGSDGLLIAYNESFLTDSMVVQVPSPWFKIKSFPLQLDASDSDYLTFEVDATDLQLGLYKGELLLSGQDSASIITAQGVEVLLLVDSITGIENPGPAQLPAQFWLAQNYPNPFNQSTQIMYSLNQSNFVTLKVFNLLGQEVAAVVEGIQSAGLHRVTWDGRNKRGEAVASGIYFYQLKTDFSTLARKLTLLK